MVKVFLIRHGATSGNLERRYVGNTDEPLCDLGIKQAKEIKLPYCDLIFSSPLARAAQTAEILFPGRKPVTVHDLREYDFGKFSGKTSDELSGNPHYIAWVEANCETAVPGGEDAGKFKERCVNAFNESIKNADNLQTAAFVTHGGCIMAILEHFSTSGNGFFGFYPENCEVICCVYEDGKLVMKGEKQC
jgi:alpha-ribazole phosphatase